MSQIPLIEDDYNRIVNAGFEKFTECTKGGEYLLRTELDGTCKALCKGKCLIYDVRPAQCKGFPLYLDMFSGLCILTDCEGVSYNENSTKDWKKEIKSVLAMYKYWIKYYESLYDLNEGE